MAQNLSESILQKRIKRFKSIKRGYYSLILLVTLYVLSLASLLWVNNKPLMIRFANGTWNEGEKFYDTNENDMYDNNEVFNDKHQYFFPAIWALKEMF